MSATKPLTNPVPRSLFLLLLAAALWAGPLQAAPDIQQWQTKNGARVLFIVAPELPMVDVRVVFDAGSARDEERPGRALLTNALLEEGAGAGEAHLDADAIAERLDALGAEFSTNSMRDMAVVSLRTLTQPELLAPALDTMALVLTAPSFPEEALERERRRVLVALKRQQQSPEEIANKAFYAALYGTHPYAIPPMGTEASVAALTREELLAHYRRYYVGRNAVVGIVGAVNRSQAEAIAEQVVGGLPAGERAPVLPEVDALPEAMRSHISHPSSQTHILLGQPGVRRGDPDYFPLYVGNHVLGGSGLVSRVSAEVREKRGLAYSAYSYFSPMNRKGPFILGLQTRNESAPEALGVLQETLARFVADGPTAEELAAAQKNITGGFALNIDSNRDKVEYLAMIGFYDLPLDYLETFPAKVQAVTVSQVKETFQRRVAPERMATVTVGMSAEDR